jgi:phosphatidylethanolamine/phosphatidyl-N-methylethanolamine N-methyltransferase
MVPRARVPLQDDLVQRQRRVYRFWAPFYDRIYGGVLLSAHRKIIELVSEEAERVLEVGVGTGLLLPKYPRRLRIIGIDISEHMIAKARKKVFDQKLSNVELRVGDAGSLDFGPATFDVVILPFVITLLPNPEEALDECVRVLKPGGTIIIAGKISDGAGVQGFLEKSIAPIVERIGWSSRFRSQRLLGWIERHNDVVLTDWLPVPPFRLFKVVRLRGESITRGNTR